MTLKLDPKYMGFYLDGQDAGSKVFDPEIDLDQVAQQVLKTGESPHAVLLVAVTDAAKHLEVGPQKQAWKDKHKRDLEDFDADLAYKHYVQGLIDDCVSEHEADKEDGLIPALSLAWEEGEEDDDEDDEPDEPRKRR